MRNKLLSIGIDLGTTTTQIVFSRIYIENAAPSAAIPQMTITKKEILYKSPIYFTPLKSPTEIDTDAVMQILQNTYQAAGFATTDVDTGAVIITGETARKENANAVLQMLSAFSGEFVVATAGADLESILSAKGAAIDRISETENITCANLDIGGGTTNIAVFNCGKLQDTACFDIGGRLICYDTQKIITYIAPKLQTVICEQKLALSVGSPLQLNELDKLLTLLIGALEQAFGLRQSLYHNLLVTHKSLQNREGITHISVTGGVADSVYTPQTTPYKFGDIGIFLGQKLKKSALFSHFSLKKGAETIRATVVGAGSHSTTLSGSTVYYDASLLPIKNLSVSHCDACNVNIIPETAIVIENLKNTDYSTLNDLATRMAEKLSPRSPAVFIFKQDIGKAFGYILQSKLPNQKIISMDSLQVAAGDFIDIGKPAADGTVLPVVIKTLLFQ